MEAQWQEGEAQQPSPLAWEALPWEPQPHRLGVRAIMVSQWEMVPQAPHNWGSTAREHDGTRYGTLWKTTLGLHGTYHEMSTRGIKSGERNRSRWFGEEQAWENRGIRGLKELVSSLV